MSEFRDSFSRTESGTLGSDYEPVIELEGTAGVNGAYAYADPQNWIYATLPVAHTGEGTIQYDFWVPADVEDDWPYYEAGWGLIPDQDAVGWWYTSIVSVTRSGGGGSWRIDAGTANHQFTVEASTWYTAKAQINLNFLTHDGITRVKVWKKGDPEPEDFQDSGLAIHGNTPGFGSDYIAIGGAEVEPGRFDNLRIWDTLVDITPVEVVLEAEPKTSATVVIKYNNNDITQWCSIADSTFTTRASGSPGQAVVTFKDTRQRFTFIPGKKLELFIDDVRQWDGYALSLGYNYWFETHTANCEPCPHVTPRKLVLYGADRNVLLARRVLYNKADPEGDPFPDIVYFPADTPDNEVITQFIDDYVDDLDGIDYTTKVEHVGTPDPYVEFRVPGPSSYLLQLLTEVAQSTGAIFYIDPDRYLIYTDVNNPDAPWVLTDQPTGAGEIGYQGVEILSDGGRLINDAMIWGAGQGSPNIAFQRVQDEESIEAHGRWQNTGGFRFNLWQASSVQRVAESIIYGSPSSKRGHKDPVISVRCKTFHHGFRVAQKATVISEVFDFEDVIPIREITISFINPTQPQYDLVLSHDIDEPWTTSEFWWPKPDDETGPPEPPGPGTVCTFPMTTDTGIGVAWGENSGDPPPNATALLNDIDNQVAIEHGDGFPPNKWNYWQSMDGVDFLSNNDGDILVTYRLQFADKYWYNVGNGDLQVPGEQVLTWENRRIGLQAPPRPEGETGPSFYYCHLTGEVSLEANETDRDVSGFLLGVSRDNNQPNMVPQLVQIGFLQPITGYQTYFDGVARLQPSPPPHHVGSVIWEGSMVDEDVIPINSTFTVSAGDTFYLGIDIEEPEGSKPWLTTTATLTVDISWTEAQVNYAGIGVDGDGVACYEVGFGSTNVYHPATLLYGTTYRVPLPYVPGTTRVYVDGIHWTDYTESSPTLGQIVLGHAVDGDVTVAYISAVSNLALPDAPGYFIVPTSGPITGTFGAQTSSWPPAYWHGQWYDHFHNGVDYGVAVGTPVYASADGFVRHETQVAGGTMIHIFHENGLRSTYAHLSQRLVNDGVTVSQGDIIAYSGATGEVTGPHLHWGCVFQGSPEDPLGFV